MDYFLMKKSDFKNLPLYQDYEHSEDEKYTSFIILPTTKKHDSGYRIMNFVLCKGSEPVCRIEGCADVVHLDGIGGYGPIGSDYTKHYPSGWSVDCIPCGYLRFFANRPLTIEGWFGSDFSIYCEPRQRKESSLWGK